MKRNLAFVMLAAAALLAATLACGGSISTANISNAWTATDENGQNSTTVFAPDAVFYAMADLKNAPDDTKVKAVWTAVNVENTEPNLVITETEITSSDALLHFRLENTDSLWPAGQYKVELYLNDKLDKTLTFEVQ